MNTTLTITAKGQVTLRKEILEHLGVRPGDRVIVDMRVPGHVALSRLPSGTIQDFFGCLPDPGVRMTIEEMNKVIEGGWSGP